MKGLNMTNFNIIGFTDDPEVLYEIQDGDNPFALIQSYVASIEYQPDIRYKINIRSAFNPEIIHRKHPFNHDTIIVEAVLSPIEYASMVSLLSNTQNHRIEFTINNAIVQFPVILDKLPPMTENGRTFHDRYKFTFISVYTDNPFIDFAIARGFGSSFGSFFGFS
jgi:hypothetical protein